MTQFYYAALLVFATLVSSVSQVMLKKSANRIYPDRLREYLNPLVLTAYVLFFASAVMTILSYKVVDVSYGAMLETSAYIFVFLFDWLYFKEEVNSRKIVAILLIILGVAIATGQ